MSIDVTVGIPYHSGVKPEQLYLAIDSILNQSVAVKKIHLIQDGSVGIELEGIVQQFNHQPTIDLLVFNKNYGLAYVLNHSIKLAETKYYARMDADDISEKHRIEKQFSFMEKNHNIDIIGTWAKDIDLYGNELTLRKTPIGHSQIYKYIWTCPFIHPTVMFRRESILRTGLYNVNLKRRQDYDLWFRCAKLGLQFANLPEPLLKYRFTDDWFNKNNSNIIWTQVKMGWKGCKMLRLSPVAYVGVFVPMIKILFPKRLGIFLSNLLKRIDPRNRISS